jgi:hypothetical protein
MKKETVAEFLARGGKITKVPANVPTQKVENIRSNNANSGIVTIVSMEDADLYHGEVRKGKTRKKTGTPIAPTIDVSALPEALRKKYVDKLMAAKKERDDE